MSSLLIEAFEINLKNKQFNLARETLGFLPEDIAAKLKEKLKESLPKAEKMKFQPKPNLMPKVEFKSLQGSVVDWENHADFAMAGNCFLCNRPFSREESKLIGIGPKCGNWNYSFDPRDSKNKEKLEKIKRTVRQKVIEGKTKLEYTELIQYINKITNRVPIIGFLGVASSGKAIQIDIDGIMKVWIPIQHCVYYFGAFYVRTWKVKEILGEFVRKL